MRKDLTKIMGRKWRCEQTVGGPRGPPCPFPAVWPCEAVCAGFPAQVASLPHLTPENALSRPVWRVCGGDRENAGPPGGRADGEKKKVRDKERGLRSAPARPTPPRNAGRGRGLQEFRPGVNAGVRFKPRGSVLPPRGRNCPPFREFRGFQAGVRLKIREMEGIYAQRENQVCSADYTRYTAACQRHLSAG